MNGLHVETTSQITATNSAICTELINIVAQILLDTTSP